MNAPMSKTAIKKQEHRQKTAFGVAGMMFCDVIDHDQIVVARAILRAAQELAEYADIDPIDFLTDAITARAVDYAKRGFISADQVEVATLPLNFFADQYLGGIGERGNA